MIGAEVDLKGCSVLLAGDPRASQRTAALLASQGSEVVLADDSVRAVGLLPQADALAICDADPARFDTLVAAAAALRVPVLRFTPAPRGGSITLLGGGPGALDLLTVRGVRALSQANVVFADRLGPGEHLAELAPQARIVDVGKQPGHHRVTQREIEEQMIGAARAGEHVVRLKGGDPFVFGRGFEELAAATAAGVAVSVVPGISSCISVPAAAGIPVTARGVNRAFTVISGHDPIGADQLQHLARLGGTLVILMGMGTLEHTVAGLRRAGMEDSMPCAIIQSGTTGDQRTTHATLHALPAAARTHRNPAVIVIGQVAALPQTLLADQLAAMEVAR